MVKMCGEAGIFLYTQDDHYTQIKKEINKKKGDGRYCKKRTISF